MISTTSIAPKLFSECATHGLSNVASLAIAIWLELVLSCNPMVADFRSSIFISEQYHSDYIMNCLHISKLPFSDQHDRDP